ncbi:hypothetical protein H0H87_001413 [Tephrocybe sp. NHM501043]|nr:hypothetical protein H0H87_001413 [Tephrocybe sp. NHM501043]
MAQEGEQKKRKAPESEDDWGEDDDEDERGPSSSQPTQPGWKPQLSAGSSTIQQRQLISLPAASPAPQARVVPHLMQAPTPSPSLSAPAPFVHENCSAVVDPTLTRKKHFLFTCLDPDSFDPKYTQDTGSINEPLGTDAAVDTDIGGATVARQGDVQVDDEGWERDWESPPPQILLQQPQASGSRKAPQKKLWTVAGLDWLRQTKITTTLWAGIWIWTTISRSTPRDAMWDSLIDGTAAKTNQTETQIQGSTKGKA